eukprot:1804858-Karenia_brevis.AAC.1
MSRDIDAKERVVVFMPACAAYLYNRPHRGEEEEEGIRRVKSIKRIPRWGRWSEDKLRWVKWAP